jgi:hypothetical protein
MSSTQKKENEDLSIIQKLYIEYINEPKEPKKKTIDDLKIRIKNYICNHLLHKIKNIDTNNIYIYRSTQEEETIDIELIKYNNDSNLSTKIRKKFGSTFNVTTHTHENENDLFNISIKNVNDKLYRINNKTCLNLSEKPIHKDTFIEKYKLGARVRSSEDEISIDEGSYIELDDLDFLLNDGKRVDHMKIIQFLRNKRKIEIDQDITDVSNIKSTEKLQEIIENLLSLRNDMIRIIQMREKDNSGLTQDEIEQNRKKIEQEIRYISNRTKYIIDRCKNSYKKIIDELSESSKPEIKVKDEDGTTLIRPFSENLQHTEATAKKQKLKQRLQYLEKEDEKQKKFLLNLMRAIIQTNTDVKKNVTKIIKDYKRKTVETLDELQKTVLKDVKEMSSSPDTESTSNNDDTYFKILLVNLENYNDDIIRRLYLYKSFDKTTIEELSDLLTSTGNYLIKSVNEFNNRTLIYYINIYYKNLYLYKFIEEIKDKSFKSKKKILYKKTETQKIDITEIFFKTKESFNTYLEIKKQNYSEAEKTIENHIEKLRKLKDDFLNIKVRLFQNISSFNNDNPNNKIETYIHDTFNHNIYIFDSFTKIANSEKSKSIQNVIINDVNKELFNFINALICSHKTIQNYDNTYMITKLKVNFTNLNTINDYIINKYNSNMLDDDIIKTLQTYLTNYRNSLFLKLFDLKLIVNHHKFINNILIYASNVFDSDRIINDMLEEESGYNTPDSSYDTKTIDESTTATSSKSNSDKSEFLGYDIKKNIIDNIYINITKYILLHSNFYLYELFSNYILYQIPTILFYKNNIIDRTIKELKKYNITLDPYYNIFEINESQKNKYESYKKYLLYAKQYEFFSYKKCVYNTIIPQNLNLKEIDKNTLTSSQKKILDINSNIGTFFTIRINNSSLIKPDIIGTITEYQNNIESCDFNSTTTSEEDFNKSSYLDTTPNKKINDMIKNYDCYHLSIENSFIILERIINRYNYYKEFINYNKCNNLHDYVLFKDYIHSINMEKIQDNKYSFSITFNLLNNFISCLKKEIDENFTSIISHDNSLIKENFNYTIYTKNTESINQCIDKINLIIIQYSSYIKHLKNIISSYNLFYISKKNDSSLLLINNNPYQTIINNIVDENNKETLNIIYNKLNLIVYKIFTESLEKDKKKYKEYLIEKINEISKENIDTLNTHIRNLRKEIIIENPNIQNGYIIQIFNKIIDIINIDELINIINTQFAYNFKYTKDSKNLKIFSTFNYKDSITANNKNDIINMIFSLFNIVIDTKKENLETKYNFTDDKLEILDRFKYSENDIEDIDIITLDFLYKDIESRINKFSYSYENLFKVRTIIKYQDYSTIKNETKFQENIESNLKYIFSQKDSYEYFYKLNNVVLTETEKSTSFHTNLYYNISIINEKKPPEYINSKNLQYYNIERDFNLIFDKTNFESFHFVYCGYGYSGSGKTTTLLKSVPNVNVSILDKLIEKMINNRTDFTYNVNCTEDYGEITDDSCINKGFNDVSDKTHFLYNENITYNENQDDLNLSNNSQTYKLRNFLRDYINEERQKNVHIRKTPNNDESSRSHLFITFNILNNNTQQNSKITILDMAGAENVDSIQEDYFVKNHTINFDNLKKYLFDTIYDIKSEMLTRNIDISSTNTSKLNKLFSPIIKNTENITIQNILIEKNKETKLNSFFIKFKSWNDLKNEKNIIKNQELFDDFLLNYNKENIELLLFPLKFIYNIFDINTITNSDLFNETGLKQNINTFYDNPVLNNENDKSKIGILQDGNIKKKENTRDFTHMEEYNTNNNTIELLTGYKKQNETIIPEFTPIHFNKLFTLFIKELIINKIINQRETTTTSNKAKDKTKEFNAIHSFLINIQNYDRIKTVNQSYTYHAQKSINDLFDKINDIYKNDLIIEYINKYIKNDKEDNVITIEEINQYIKTPFGNVTYDKTTNKETYKILDHEMNDIAKYFEYTYREYYKKDINYINVYLLYLEGKRNLIETYNDKIIGEIHCPLRFQGNYINETLDQFAFNINNLQENQNIKETEIQTFPYNILYMHNNNLHNDIYNLKIITFIHVRVDFDHRNIEEYEKSKDNLDTNMMNYKLAYKKTIDYAYKINPFATMQVISIEGGGFKKKTKSLIVKNSKKNQTKLILNDTQLLPKKKIKKDKKQKKQDNTFFGEFMDYLSKTFL